LAKNKSTKLTAPVIVRKITNKERIREIIKKPKEKFLTKNQEKYWEILGDNQITLCFGPAGVGKAQPLDSIIYTPTGRKTMGEIEVGDYVISDNGKQCKVIATHPQGVKPIYKVTFSDGSSTECCDEHLWLTKTEDEFTIKELSEIKENYLLTKHYIPLTEPVNFEEKNIKSGGSFNYVLGKYINVETLFITHINLDFVLFNSIECRIDFLQGALDVNGFIEDDKIIFTATSEYVRDFMKLVVNSLGGVAELNEGTFTLSIKLPNYIVPFTNQEKLEKYKETATPTRYITNIEYVGYKEAKCITIDSDSHLYLTDDFIVTHNSYIAMKRAIDLLHDENNKYEKIIIVRPAVEAEEKLGSLPGNLEEKLDPYIYPSYYLLNKIVGKEARETLKEEGFIEIAALAYMRGWNVDNTILVFEEAQNATPAQIKLLLTRIGFNSKFFISGDLEQSDKFKDKTKSGLYDAKKRLQGVKSIGIFEFGSEDIVRNPLIGLILERYE